MRRRFVGSQQPATAARLIRTLVPSVDVYLGVALREGAARGGRRSIAGSRLVWIDCDGPRSAALVAAFAHPPSMLIASGSVDHVHAYWLLRERASPAHVESANRRLAALLGGDAACTDIARILRPPGTFNHKHDPPRPVRLLVHRPDRCYSLSELTHCLPPDPTPSHATRARAVVIGRARSTELDRWLLAIPAAEYVAALTGRVPDRAGKVLCPFHSERVASLQLYPDGSFYCFGSACGRGGSIFDFAAHLWGVPPRGDGFIELRARLAERLGPVRGAGLSGDGHPED